MVCVCMDVCVLAHRSMVLVIPLNRFSGCGMVGPQALISQPALLGFNHPEMLYGDTKET